MRVGGLIRYRKAPRSMDGLRCAPEKAALVIMILIVRISALAATIAQNGPPEFLDNAGRCCLYLSALRCCERYFRAVYRLPYLLKLMAPTVWAGKRDNHGCVVRLNDSYLYQNLYYVNLNLTIL